MTAWSEYSITGAEDTLWDVIVVGAGLGGSIAGWSLARHGLKVLFLERGGATNAYKVPPRRGAWRRLVRANDSPEQRAATGLWPDPLRIISKGVGRDFLPPIGFGPGGSSAVYGAALERLRRIDFAPTPSEQRGPEALSDGWPLDYDAFAKWYAAAEELMTVAGTPDPGDSDDLSQLRCAPCLSARDEFLFRAFEMSGLQPYRLHVGIAYRPGCTECLGGLCPRACKADGASRALSPALTRHGAKLVLQCAVDRLDITGNRIAQVRSQTRAYRARLVVLAAGALTSPNILRRSVSERWPQGIGNDHDLVGRGLMFHVSDFFVLRATGNHSPLGPAKTLASRAFYDVDGVRYGSFQSIGRRMAIGNVYQYLVERWQHTLPRVIPPPRLLLLAAAAAGRQIVGDAPLFATIVEDFPYRFNQVVPDASAPSGFVIRYEKPRELEARAAGMRSKIRTSLSTLQPWFLSGDQNLNFGHPLGTCRFGTAAETSVLTPDNRVRGIDNLFVVDGSFFPSSGGANPGLTIAANALRVSDQIAREFAAGRFAAGNAMPPAADQS